MATTISQPILVIGTHRSGTTFLGGTLARHRDVAYWEEPRHIWAHGHAFNRDDVLTAEDATPKITAYIRGAFADFLAKSGKRRLLEKTPSNCLRLDFIDRIFPDARYLHIYRDGRAVVRSTSEVNQGTPHAEWVWKRLTGTPITEWPALIPRAARTFGRKLTGRKMAYWGPCPPGWKRWVQEDAPHVILAKQWRYTIEPVLDFRERVDAARWIDMAYEDFMREPVDRIVQLQEFAGLGVDDRVVEFVRTTVDPTRQGKWRDELTDDVLADIRPVMEPALERLGYAW